MEGNTTKQLEMEQELQTHISTEKEMELIIKVLEASNNLLDFRLKKTNEELVKAHNIIQGYEAKISDLQKDAEKKANNKQTNNK